MTLSLTDPKFWKRVLSFGLWNPDTGTQIALPGRGPIATGAEVGDQRAIQVAAVFSSIRLIAETCASLPLVVYERLPDNTRKEARDHWLSKLLREPNPFMTGQEYREAIFCHIAAWGNGFSEKVPNADGKIIELWPLKPDQMKVTRNGYDSIKYEYSKTHGKKTDYKQSEILHVKGFGTDGIMGLSPLGMAREAVGLSVAAENYAASFYKNGGKPSGVLMVDKVLKPEQSAALELKYGGIVHGGEDQSNKLWILEAFAKYQAITIPPEDAQMIGTRQFQIAEIARIFRIPPHLLMDMTGSTSWGTGLEQQNLAFLTYTLRPYLTRMEQSVNRWLLPDNERGKFYVEHNVEGLLRADSAARATFYSQMVQNGIFNRNEVRGKENQAPYTGGEIYTAQSNLLPLDKLGQVPPTNPADAAAIKFLESANA